VLVGLDLLIWALVIYTLKFAISPTNLFNSSKLGSLALGIGGTTTMSYTNLR